MGVIIGMLLGGLAVLAYTNRDKISSGDPRTVVRRGVSAVGRNLVDLLSNLSQDLDTHLNNRDVRGALKPATTKGGNVAAELTGTGGHGHGDSSAFVVPSNETPVRFTVARPDGKLTQVWLDEWPSSRVLPGTKLDDELRERLEQAAKNATGSTNATGHVPRDAGDGPLY